MPNILLFSNLQPALNNLAEDLKPVGWDLKIITADSNRTEISDTVEKADFILSFGPGLTDKIIESSKDLKLIQLSSAGYDGIDLNLTNKLGVVVATNGGANAIPVAEFTLTLILSTLRHAVMANKIIKSGSWKNSASIKDLEGKELFGKTVGIIGAGRIGSTLAGILRGFETRTLYTDPIKSGKAEQFGATRVKLNQLLEESDVVTLHVPLLQSTKKMIGPAELGLMKNTAIIINTCRGMVIDEKALYQALVDGRIYGAGLDVFEMEPINTNNPLLRLDNVLLSPHVAGKSTESFPRRLRFAFENAERVWNGDKPKSVVVSDK